MEHSSRLAWLLVAGLSACGGGGSDGGSPPPPLGLSYSDADALVLSGVEIEPLLPFFDGEVDAWSVSPTLPPGLVLDPATGVVAGSPLAPAERREYVVTASNAGGAAQASLVIEITAPFRYAFLASGDDTLSALAIDAPSGLVTRASFTASPVADTGAEDVAIHPSGAWAYLAHSSSNTLVVHGLDPASGALSFLQSVPLAIGPHSIAADPTGAYVLVACQFAFQIQIFEVDPDSGLLSSAGVLATTSTPSDLCFDRNGTRVFATLAGAPGDGNASELRCWAFDPSTGSGAALGEILKLNGSRPSALVLDPRADRLYMTLDEFDGVVTVSFDAQGTLTPVPPLVPAGLDPLDVAVDPRGRFAWVASSASDELLGFAIHPETGALSALGGSPAGDGPVALAVDPLGGRVLVVARGSGELLSFAVSESGALAVERALAVRQGSTALAFARGEAPLATDPTFVRVASRDSDEVATYAITGSGTLTPSSVAFTSDRPVSLAVDGERGRALVAAQGAGAIEAFSIDAGTGALAPVGLPLIVSGLLQELRLDASGRFAYAAARDVLAPGDGWLLTFALDAGGVPALVDSRPAGLGSCAVALDVTGEFAFVGNQGDGTPGSAGIAVFRLDPRTGLPSAGGTPAPAPGVSKLALHPDGRTLYAVLSGSNALGRYTLDRVDAELTPAPPAQAPGLEPSALVLDARGRLAYAAYLEGASDGAVDVFAVAADAGLGSPLQEAVDGRDPVALALDPTGRFLYAANVASNDVSVFAIDAETGLLAARTPALAGLAPVAVTASGARR